MNKFISLSSQNSTPYICILVSYVKVWSPREKIPSVNTFLVPIIHTLTNCFCSASFPLMIVSLNVHGMWTNLIWGPPPSELSSFPTFLWISPPLQPIIFNSVFLFSKDLILNSMMEREANLQQPPPKAFQPPCCSSFLLSPGESQNLCGCFDLQAG